MVFKDKLPVSYLLFTSRGRISKLTYWTVSIFIWTAFYVLFNVIEYSISYTATIALYPILFWALFATAAKRLHDISLSTYWLLLICIPALGPLVLIYLLGLKKGKSVQNKYGLNPKLAPDYYKTNNPEKTTGNDTDEWIVNDVTQLNPIVVAKVETPQTIEALQAVIKNAALPICIGGGRFSMGGQTASKNCLHIDMRQLNKILDFSERNKTIKVEAGIRWCDIQKYIDPFNLSIKIMQTYANFTVGGALSVNCHGRYIGLGPVILSVRSLDVIIANGTMLHTSRDENPELFFACVGCYNAVAVIVAVELELEDNVAVERTYKLMDIADYKNFFLNTVQQNKNVVFHNGDIYPPKYKKVRAVSWVQTTKKPTEKTRLMPLAASYPLERYFIGAFSKSNFGKWRRQYIYEPILYAKTKIHWRNYEAGYDVAELEPESRKNSTYVLQEYFVPVQHFDAFSSTMAEIFTRHKVNVINVSIRHAFADNGSMLAWASEEVFAFVIWYKQKTDDIEKAKVGVWTRELIDAALSLNGAYYLPYQPHATAGQFHKAYPNATKLFALKATLDPAFKFRNVIWDIYYQPKDN